MSETFRLPPRWDAFAEMNRLRAEIDRLRAALRAAADFIDPTTDPTPKNHMDMAKMLRAALNDEQTGTGNDLSVRSSLLPLPPGDKR